MNTKILVVEDDAHIRFGLTELLTSEGFSVEACARGDAAVAAVEEYKPRLVVLDVMLPGLSGYEICKQLRTRGYKGLVDRKSTRLNSSHSRRSRMPSSA